MLNKLSTLRAQGVSEEGFTLIELIIVVVIIGILAAIAIPIFMNQQKSALAAGVKSDVRNTNTNIATALVKAPTAATIGTGTAAITATPTIANATTKPTTGAGIYFTNGADIAVGSATADAVISDTGTWLVVGGTWAGYSITGKNIGLNGQYNFLSSTGTNLGTGDLA